MTNNKMNLVEVDAKEFTVDDVLFFYDQPLIWISKLEQPYLCMAVDEDDYDGDITFVAVAYPETRSSRYDSGEWDLRDLFVQENPDLYLVELSTGFTFKVEGGLPEKYLSSKGARL